jgi:outer membrane protein assembly factor BamB
MCSLRFLPLALLLGLAVTAPSWARDLEAGDVVPDCGKIPLPGIKAAYEPKPGYAPVGQRAPSLEDLLQPDGVVILHFSSPRGPRRGRAKRDFAEELSALQQAAHTVPYPCQPVPVVPFGDKGREDTGTFLRENRTPVWGDTPIYYEPTFPRPGLYRTFRPGAAAYTEQDITTPWTYLIGPDRTIIAARGPEEDGQLYDWLQRSLPESVVPVAKPPSTDLSVPAADAWMWPAFRRTVRRQARTDRLPDTLPYTYVAWNRSVGRTFSSPAVVEGRVYLTTDRQGLHVLSVENGEEFGSFPTGDAWWTSPVVAGDYVYAISATGEVLALERLGLAMHWKRDLRGLITSSPVVSDGALFVGSRNGGLFALDADTGDPLWTFQTGGEISSSAALADGVVLIGSGDRSLYAIDASTGEQRWSVETGAAVDSSPTVAGEDVLVGSFDGALYSVKLADGALNWRCQLSGWVHSSPAVDDGTVFVGTVNIRRDEVPSFNWIDRETGEVKGRFEMPDAVYSSPTVWDDLVLVGCRDRRLYAFDREMKQTQPVWTLKTGSYVHSSPVVVGDTVLIASFDGHLYALRQSKPIHVWKDGDVVPRWFLAALARQLHEETGQLIERAAGGEVGQELSLTQFDALFPQIKAQGVAAETPPRVLPRDVPPDHPGAPFIEYVLTAGLLSGYPDATFHPSEPSTRYQFAGALSTVLESITQPADVWRVLRERNLTGVVVEVRVEPIADRPPIRVTDVPTGHWAQTALTQLAAKGMLLVDEEGRFRGQKLVTLSDAGTQWDLIVQSVKVVRTK